MVVTWDQSDGIFCMNPRNQCQEYDIDPRIYLSAHNVVLQSHQTTDELD